MNKVLIISLIIISVFILSQITMDSTVEVKPQTVKSEVSQKDTSGKTKRVSFSSNYESKANIESSVRRIKIKPNYLKDEVELTIEELGHDEQIRFREIKSKLKIMGTTVAMKYTDGITADLSIIRDAKFPLSVFNHPNIDEEFTKEDIFNGEGGFIPVYLEDESYTGVSDKVLFIEKPGTLDINFNIVNVVYEDGHEAQVQDKSVKEALRNAMRPEDFEKYIQRHPSE